MKKKIKNKFKYKKPVYIDYQSPEDETYIEEKFKDADYGNLPLANKEDLIKTARIFDPETPDQLKKVLDLMEKYIKSDGDISEDNISIFLYPLSKGSKKYLLRQHKIVGIMSQLWKISRQYDRIKKEISLKDKNIDRNHLIPLINSFNETLKEIRNRLAAIPVKKAVETPKTN